MSAKAAARGNASETLSRDDWIAEALNVMAEEGPRGVQIRGLCERLGVTSGSFYHHFEDLDELKVALAKRWFAEGFENFSLGPESTPRENLEGAMRAFLNPRLRDLSREMRGWSQDNEHARASSRAVDEKVFELLKKTLQAYGFSAEDAEMRARILFYTGAGFGDVGAIGRRVSRDEQIAAILDIVLG